MSRITNRLFLGNENDASDVNFLRRNNIGMVINFAVEVPKPKVYDKNIEYVKFNLNDSPGQDILPVIYKVYNFLPKYLENTRRNVLFNCYAGISRSATVLIGFLMLYLNMTLNSAFNLVKSKRKIVNPNSGFMRQLMFLDYKL